MAHKASEAIFLKHPMSPTLPAQLTQAAALIRNAHSMVIATGAGMGIDSGLPDFRGNNGFWRAYPALAQSRLKFQDIASPEAFRLRPWTAWGFYGHRLQLYRATVPHAGFGLIARWLAAMPHGGFVFTSNVDGQFQKAGFAPQRVHECHGSIHHLQCSANCQDRIWPADALVPAIDEAACQWQGELPRCPDCAALLRPNILMFDDWQWNHTHSEAQRARLDAWLDNLPQPPLVLEIGAGRAIATVRHFSEHLQRGGSPLIRINPQEVNVNNPKAVEIALGAKEALERIQTCLEGSCDA